MFQPGIIVVGSKYVPEETGPSGRKIPAHWEYGKVHGQAVHWADASSKRQFGDKKNAPPSALKIVDVFRGMGARHANEVRADIMRRRRGEEFPWTRGNR